MATLLFITEQELLETTLLGGNIDPDKFRQNIENVQNLTIQPLLGTELYDKIITDASTGGENGSLSGDYLFLYTEFVKPITKNQACAEYITVSGFMITNAGAFKNTPEGTELMDKDEKALVSTIYSQLADTAVGRFQKWIGLNPLPEYKTVQDEVNASKDIDNTGGWYLN